MAKKERQERKAQIDAWKAEIDQIKADANLSEEQKGALIKEKNAEIRSLRRAGKGKKGKKNKGAKSDSKGAAMKAINENPDLSDEEKKARRQAIKDEMKANKGEHASRGKKRGKGKAGIKKAERSAERGNLDKAQIDRAMKGLERAEKSLSKQYDKGKITEEVYNTRLAKINEVRAKLIP